MLYLSKIMLLSASLFLAEPNSALPKLDIGSQDSHQLVSETTLAPGIKYFQVNINSQTQQFTLTSEPFMKGDTNSISDYFKKIIELPNLSTLLPNYKSKDDLEKHLVISEGPVSRIYFGRFNSEAKANEMKEYLKEYGIDFNTINLSSRENQRGNFEISILEVKPSLYKGTVTSILANGVIQGTETVSNIVKKTNAYAATNGGYFSYIEDQGTPGDPAGVSIINGSLVSEGILNRPAFLIQNFPILYFEILNDVSTRISLNIGNQLIISDGINRKLKYRFNCGYVDDSKIIPANHDVVCQDEDEIVVYDQYFGDVSSLLNKKNLTVWVDEHGKIYSKHTAADSNLIPPKHYLIAATGAKKAQLKEYLINNSVIQVNRNLYSNGQKIPLREGMYVVNGGPTLLENGEFGSDKWAVQGWSPWLKPMGKESRDIRDEVSLQKDLADNRLGFYDAWVNQRHPRTAVGITKSGKLYLVVIYGRNPTKSIGASITEMASIMRSLGVTDALNLDGGGSSVMVVKDNLTGVPSDDSGERMVADSIVFIPNNKD